MHLQNIPGGNYSPLAYLLRGTTTTPVTTDDLMPGKCYSLTHKSLAEEIVAKKSHNGTCVETDKVTLFGLLVKVLKDGHLELTL